MRIDKIMDVGALLIMKKEMKFCSKLHYKKCFNNTNAGAKTIVLLELVKVLELQE